MKKKYKIVKEACVENFSEAKAVESAGANRIELCADLHLDGLTPNEETIYQTLKGLNIPVKVMIRPRKGDFNYNSEELEKMKQSIEMCKQLGVFGVVFGILKNDQLDIDKINYLCKFAEPLNICIHKAIDLVKNPVDEVERLKKHTPVNSILTSGGKQTAMLGAKTICKMAEVSDHIKIITAGKVTFYNLDEIVKLTGINEFHGRRIVSSQTIL